MSHLSGVLCPDVGIQRVMMKAIETTPRGRLEADHLGPLVLRLHKRRSNVGRDAQLLHVHDRKLQRLQGGAGRVSIQRQRPARLSEEGGDE